MSEWKDYTSYRQSGKRVTTAFELKSGEIRIVITKAHLNNPGYWTIHCRAVGIDTYDTKLPADQPAELAQQMAINIVSNKLRDLAASLRKVK